MTSCPRSPLLFLPYRMTSHVRDRACFLSCVLGWRSCGRVQLPRSGHAAGAANKLVGPWPLIICIVSHSISWPTLTDNRKSHSLHCETPQILDKTAVSASQDEMGMSVLPFPVLMPSDLFTEASVGVERLFQRRQVNGARVSPMRLKAQVYTPGRAQCPAQDEVQWQLAGNKKNLHPSLPPPCPPCEWFISLFEVPVSCFGDQVKYLMPPAQVEWDPAWLWSYHWSLQAHPSWRRELREGRFPDEQGKVNAQDSNTDNWAGTSGQQRCFKACADFRKFYQVFSY